MKFFKKFYILVTLTLFVFNDLALCSEDKATIKTITGMIQERNIKSSIDDKIKEYESNPKHPKLENKWKKALEDRIRHIEDYSYYSENYKIAPNVLFHIRSKEKNLEMSYTNPNKVPKKEFRFTPLTKEERERYEKIDRESIDKFYTPPHIPKCEKSFTETEANPMKDRYKDVEATEIIFDDLLLSKNVLKYIEKESIISKDYFGNKNQIDFYSEEFLDFFSLGLKDANIKCLPFRLIVTRDNYTKHYGVNALKNYDFNKKGELHYNVKKKLSSYTLNFK